MNILIIHNYYSVKGGEEYIVELQKKLFEQNNHNVFIYSRDYKELDKWFLGRIWGTFTSIYNPRSIKELKRILSENKIEIAILHNLLPIISPCIIPLLKRNGVEIIQTVHNYRLLCPTGIFFNKGRICEKCTTGIREWNCFTNNCNKNLFSSLSFSIRSYFIRKMNYYHKIDRFLTISDFQKNKLINNGFPEDKINTLPNTIEIKNYDIDVESKNYIGFVGRLSYEKGIFDFIEIANQMPKYNFKVAGEMTKDLNNITIPNNLEFLGFLNPKELDEFYLSCKVILVLSKWYEPFGLVNLESMLRGTPIIAYDIGAIPEIIENAKEGFVIKQGEIKDVISHIEYMYKNKDKYEIMVANSIDKINRFSTQIYYTSLIQSIKSK